MKALRYLALVLLLVIAPSCGEPPSAPAPAPQAPEASLIGDILRPTGLLKCSDLPYAEDTETIGPLGGRLTAGPHTLTIPPGALGQATTITMSAPTGMGVNIVHFEPEGLEFARGASLTMSYANCNLLGRLLPKRIAYTTPNLNILYYLLSLDNIFAKKVTGRVDHFSDYVVAW